MHLLKLFINSYMLVGRWQIGGLVTFNYLVTFKQNSQISTYDYRFTYLNLLPS